MGNERRIASIDWAMKNMLRNKANFDILEGFLSALLKDENLSVLNLLESESNQEQERSKFNRVDMLVQDGNGRRIIIEIQSQWETDYIERLIWGASKALVESIELGTDYSEISKVISISILHFDLGVGDDYIYHAGAEFRGIHTNKPLIVKEKVKEVGLTEKTSFKIKENMFPEYYLIKVNKFEDAINDDIDEWIYLFKHNKGRDEFRAKNIQRAIEKLDLMKMSEEKRKEYERYIKNLVIEKDIVATAIEDGIEKGREEGRAEGASIKAIAIAEKMIKKNKDDNEVAEFTELSLDEIMEIRKLLGL